MKAPRAEASLSLLLALIAIALCHSGMLLPPSSLGAGSGNALPTAAAPEPRSLTTDDYLSLVAPDYSYRPLALQSLKVDALLGNRGRMSQLIQLVCHLAVVALAFALLRRLLSDFVLAGLGAALFGVLPIQVDAVASPAGRACLLGGLCVLPVCLLVLANSRRGAGGRESLAIAVLVSALTLAALFADGATIASIFLVVGLLALLRKPLPWVTIASLACAALAWVSIRHLALGPGGGRLTFVQNPLVEADLMSRVLNGVRLLALTIWKILCPLGLSADYSFDEVRVLSPSSVPAWIIAATCVLALLGLLLLARRRSHPAFVGLCLFVVALLPGLHLFGARGPIFAERTAYVASFWLVLALCGFLAPFRRGVMVPILSVLLLAFGVRTWLRSHEWRDPVLMGLRLADDAPRSTYAQLRTAIAYVRLHDLLPAAEKPGLLARAKEHIQKALEIYPKNGRAEELYARILFDEKRYKEALERFTEATSILARQDVPEVEPILYRLRGECYLRLGQPAKAIEDFDPYLLLLSHQKSPPDPFAHNFRGLALGMEGKLEEALREFDRSIEVKDDVPAFWNNRGFCRFRLRDLRGALSDYERGLELCRGAGILRSDDGESVLLFLNRIASLQEEIARTEAAAGNVEASRAALLDAARRKAEAASLPPALPPEAVPTPSG